MISWLSNFQFNEWNLVDMELELHSFILVKRTREIKKVEVCKSDWFFSRNAV